MSEPPAPAALPTWHRWLLLHVGLPLGVLVATYALRDVLTPVIAALFLAYVFSPAVDRLERRRVPRSAGALLVLAVLVLALVAIVVGLLPALLGEFRRFVEQLPELIEELRTKTLPQLGATLGIDLPDDLGAALVRLAASLREHAPDAVEPLARLVGSVVEGAFVFVRTLFMLLLVPILTFFLLRDFPRLVGAVRRELPARYRASIEAYVREVDEIMSRYLRGQMLVVLANVVLYAVGLGLLGLRLGWAIGALAGLLTFVPYVGFAIGLTISLLMALVTFEGIWTFVGIAAVFGAVQLVEGLVLGPVLVGRRVGLGMVWVLVAILVFGATLGFVGVLLAVPLAAVFRTSFRRLLAWRAQVDREIGDGMPTGSVPGATSSGSADAAPSEPTAPAASEAGDRKEPPP